MLERVEAPALQLGGVRAVLPFAERLYRIPPMFDELTRLQQEAGILAAGCSIALYRMLDEDRIEVSVGMEMDDLLEGFERFDAPQTPALRFRHKGSFAGLPEAYRQLSAYVEEQGIMPSGLKREVNKLIAQDERHNVVDVYLDLRLP